MKAQVGFWNLDSNISKKGWGLCVMAKGNMFDDFIAEIAFESDAIV